MRSTLPDSTAPLPEAQPPPFCSSARAELLACTPFLGATVERCALMDDTAGRAEVADAELATGARAPPRRRG